MTRPGPLRELEAFSEQVGELAATDRISPGAGPLDSGCCQRTTD